MRDLYPVMLDIKGKQAVVVGGGKVAERKVSGLVGAGAKVRVVSPSVTVKLQKMAEREEIFLVKQPYSRDLIRDGFILIAATNDSEVNLQVHRDASRNQLVNMVDRPDLSNYHVPSILRRGKLVITVSTGGASPILARKLKERIAEIIEPSYVEFVDFLFEARKTILRNVKDPEKKQMLLSEIASPAFFKSDDRNGKLEILMQRMLEGE